MAHETRVIIPPAAAACAAPMTRAALLALRAASSLSKDCHYIVTDWSQGSIGVASILLHATDSKHLSEHAQVHTNFDANTAWVGRYDIDDNLMYELKDNRGNEMIGDRVFGAGPVTTFDWGNATYSGCSNNRGKWTMGVGSILTVVNVQVSSGGDLDTVGAGGTFQINGLVVSGGSTVRMGLCTAGSVTRCVVDQRGLWNNTNGKGAFTDVVVARTDPSGLDTTLMSGGVMDRVSVTDGGTLNIGGNAVNWSKSVVTGNATIVGTQSNNQSVSSCHFSGGATVTGSVAAQGFTLSNSTFASKSTTTASAAGAAFTMSDSSISNGSQILVSAGSGAVVLTRCVLEAVANLQAASGAVTMTGVKVINGFVTKGISALGALTVLTSVITANSILNHQGAGAVSIQRTSISGAGSVDFAAGSAGSVSLFNVTIEGGNVSLQAGSTAGSFNMSGDVVSSGALIVKNSVAPMSLTNNIVTSGGSINALTGGTRTVSVSRNNVSSSGRADFSGTGAGIVDVVNDCTIDQGGLIAFTSTGAASNQILQSRASSFGAIAVTGTQTGLVAVGLVAESSGSMSFLNNVALPNINRLTVNTGGSMLIANLTASRTVRDCICTTRGNINISGSVAGVVENSVVESAGALNVTLTSSTVSAVHCLNGGIIAANAGSVTRCRKANPSTLTIGNFTHTNIIHESAVNKVLTAANANRADYLGLAVQLI